METIFPSQPGFGSVFLVGYRKSPAALSKTQRVGVGIVKRRYRLPPAGETLVPDDVAAEIWMQDHSPIRARLDADWAFDEGAECRILFTRESDLVAFKPRADLVVLGHQASFGGPLPSGWSAPEGEIAGYEGEVSLCPARIQVTSAGAPVLRLERKEASSRVPLDFNDLFGFHLRAFEPRQSEFGDFHLKGSDWPDPAEDPLYAPGFSNDSFNVHRRSQEPLEADIPEGAYLEPGAEVSIERFDAGGDPMDTIRFSLGSTRLSARYLYYRGRGDDRPLRWCCASLSEIYADTLAVDLSAQDPAAHRAYVTWRVIWDFDELPLDRYRRLEVSLEEE